MKSSPQKPPRARAAVILLNQDQLLVIHRFKNGQDYYVLPGGGIEKRETPVEAALREMKEETSLDVEIELNFYQFINQGNPEYYFVARKFSGELFFGGPELKKISNTNKYELQWVSSAQLKNLNFYPVEIKTKILDELF